MRYIQFRIHPSVGIARMGDSEDVYYLASDFPQFMQEQFPALRLKPRPRTMPPVDGVAAAPAAASFTIFDEAMAVPMATVDKFKDKSGKILPQAARFRVFAYVYDGFANILPSRVFEVTTDHAEIEWKVKLANLKTQTTSGEAVIVGNDTEAVVATDAARLTRQPVTPAPAASVPAADSARPPLGYLFLERRTDDAAQLTGRVHLIGNHGETRHFGSSDPRAGDLWKSDWFDSAADGPVTATVKPKGGGAALGAAAGTDELSYLAFGTKDPRPSASTAQVEALPAWAVVGLPDYCPDIGHVVSLWDVALSQALNFLDPKSVKDDPTHHRLIGWKNVAERYRAWDYRVHIHPQLCIFADVNWVAGATSRQPVAPLPTQPGHNVRGPVGPAPTAGTDDEVMAKQITRGGVQLKPRSMSADLADPTKLRDSDPKKPINEWLKIALHKRLRSPGTLYRSRGFIEGSTASKHDFPRNLGRRWNFTPDRKDVPAAKKKIAFPQAERAWPPGGEAANLVHERIPGSLRDYHGKILKDKAHELCGGNPPALKSGATHPAGYDDQMMAYLDDMYWPVSSADMPLLRELAFTDLQYEHFKSWCGLGATLEKDIFEQIVAGYDFAVPLVTDVDGHLAVLSKRSPTYVPALIDMASLGSMLGGSFLPGIEVGLEGARQSNWTLYHGGNDHFPDVRFERSAIAGEAHFSGMLTKDLAIPWQNDFLACNETYWPTSRPGAIKTSATGTSRRWIIRREDLGLGASGPDTVSFYVLYWKKLGFIRRKDPVAAGDEPVFLETEKNP